MKAYHFTNEEIASFCDALGYLLEAGIGYGDAITLLARDEDRRERKERLNAMARAADGGSRLHSLMEEAGCFPEYVCRLVQVGEGTGKVSQTLFSLAGHYRRRQAMIARLRDALLYPGVLLLVLLGVVGVLLIWVMPVFQEVYAGLGSSLDGFAGWLLAFGRGLGKALPWIAGGVAVLALAAMLPPVKKQVQAWLRRTASARNIASGQYMQALSLAMSCGMEQQEGARLAACLASGELAQRCDALCQSLSRGEALAVALEQQGFLTAADRRLLEAATRAGQQEKALQTLADSCTGRSEDALERKLARLEPLMVALGCALIAGVLLAVMIPLMGIMNALG